MYEASVESCRQPLCATPHLGLEKLGIKVGKIVIRKGIETLRIFMLLASGTILDHELPDK